MMLNVHRGLLIAASACGFTGVLAGTFGAHGLKGRVAEDMLRNFETGVHYHLAHAIALVGIAVVAGLLPRSTTARAAGWCMVAGIVVFSGSLYVMAITGQKWLGMITPFGGVSLLAGWACLIIAAIKSRTQLEQAA